MPSDRTYFSILGPGIVFAAGAVGISHLVQSTRAGADYGLSLTLVIIFFCLLKYPALRFGNEYAAITGESLLQAYRRQGIWALTIYAVVAIFTSIFVLAALSLVTAALLKTVTGLDSGVIVISGSLIILSITLLITGHYHFFERFTKFLVALFTVLIIIAVVLVTPKIHLNFSAFIPPVLETKTIIFIIAMAGFMPTPLDSSILQSLWTVAKKQDQGSKISAADARLDFNTGFIITLFLALGFMLLGAALMHGSGLQFPDRPAAFAARVIELFTQSIGQWSFVLIGVAAMAIMYSSLLAVMDGYSRVIENLVSLVHKQPPGTVLWKLSAYDLSTLCLGLLAFGVLLFLLQSFTTFIDMVTILGFLTSPLYAFLNHRAMFGHYGIMDEQPGPLIRHWSQIAIIIFTMITLYYLYLRIWQH